MGKGTGYGMEGFSSHSQPGPMMHMQRKADMCTHLH